MKILSVEWKNFSSYGNKKQSILFNNDKEFNVLVGISGSGKSSILDVITYSLYGKCSTRKNKDLPNRVNKNLWVYIKFIAANGSLVEIERGLEPSFLVLKIGGEIYDLPDKRNINSYIETELIKIPFNIFTNTISLSVNDFKSFIKLTNNDKKKIIDRIFGYDLINLMNDLLKEKTKDIKQNLDKFEAQIESIESQLINSKEEKEKLIKRVEDGLSKEKEELLVKKSELSKKKDSLLIEFNKLVKLVSDIRNEITKISKEKNELEYRNSNDEDKLKFLENEKCPHCESGLTGDFHTEIKNTIRNIIQERKDNILKLDKSIREIESKLDIENKNKNSKQEEHWKIETSIKQINNRISEIDSKINTNEQVKSLDNIINNLETKKKDLKKSKLIIEQKNNIYTITGNMLGEDGIKKLLLTQILPTFNNYIKELSEQLEYEFDFFFDTDFNPVIRQIGFDISPESLSTGQRKKMDIIIIISILKLIKMKLPTINLLFLDEIFSSLDPRSIEKVSCILKEFISTSNMNLFVVSHNVLPREMFDRQYNIIHERNFSDIIIEKNV